MATDWNVILCKCYLCNRPFDGNEVTDHGEHVIQNGIGGLLIVEGILCESCGTKLGASVDDRLGKGLRALCVVFDIRRDRDKRLVVPADVTLQNGLILDPADRSFLVEYGAHPRPDGPAIIRNDAAMIAYVSGSNERQIRDYAKSPAIAKLIASGYEIQFKADLGALIDRVILRVDCDSIDLSRGLIKIAIGYARHQGIARSLLEHLILDDRDIITDDERIRAAVSAYYPTGWGEALYEAERYSTDDFSPNHQLTLFSCGSRLFCYIDLFGVIQRYVLLSDKWAGSEVRARYVQRCPKWVYDETDGRTRRIQDLHMMAGEFKVATAGRSWDDIARDVRHAATSRPYELPSGDHLEKPANMLLHLVTMVNAPPPLHQVTTTVRRRAAIAATIFGSDVETSLSNNRLKVLQFVRDWDVEDFRIRSEKGFSPDHSALVQNARIIAFRDFRLRQFTEAFAYPWLIKAG